MLLSSKIFKVLVLALCFYASWSYKDDNILNEGLKTTGYDCAKTSANFTTIALDNVGSCEVKDQVISGKNKYAQIIQISSKINTPVRRCKILHKVKLYRCSAFSDLQMIRGDYSEVVLKLDSTTCDNLIKNNAYITPSGSKFYDLKSDYNNVRVVYENGEVGDGYCKGITVNLNGVSHDKVVSRDIYYIYYEETEIMIDHITKTVPEFKNNVKATKGYYHDSINGDYFWDYFSPNLCDGDRLTELYDGPILHYSLKGQREVGVINTTTTAFGVEMDLPEELCGREIRKLYNKDIFVYFYENKAVKGKFNSKSKSLIDLDLMLNVDSRLIYLDRHYKSQMEKLGTYLAIRLCEMQKKILKRLLDMAYILPERFVTELMGSEGYMIDIRGSIGYIHQCEKVTVELRQTKSCYQQIPVTYMNGSYFLHPDSKVLRPHGEELSCSIIAPTMYQLNGYWFRTYPLLEYININVIRLNPNENLTWEYDDSGSFNRRALYTKEQLADYRNSLHLRSSIDSVTHNIGRGALGHSLSDDSIDLSNLISVEGYKSILNNASKYLLTSIWSLGNITSNLFGLYLIYRGCTMLCHWISNCYVIYKQHGFNIRLLGSFSNMFTKITTAQGDYSINLKERLFRRKSASSGKPLNEEKCEENIEQGKTHCKVEIPPIAKRTTNLPYSFTDDV